MCGIAAAFSAFDTFPIKNISAMIGLANHRGPDGSGLTYLESNQFIKTQNLQLDRPSRIALAHTRLSIIDTSYLSDQPMIGPANKISIVFNGEIYNYLEIKKELQSYGHEFISSGDTEVLLKSYLQWGTKCLSKLRGMFAFVIFDVGAGVAFAARDRFGIKPLYYWQDNEGIIYFASEIKQFCCLPSWKSRINPNQVGEFLLYGITDHSEKTMFRDVKQVLPSQYLLLSLNNGNTISEHKWYEIPEQKFEGTFSEATDQFRELFFDSMSMHLRSDVPIGSCLSGGIDSSSIVSTAPFVTGSNNLNHMTFTASSEQYLIDETRYANLVNEKAGSKGYFITPDGHELWDKLDQITWHQDLPFISSSVFAQWSVFELAAKKRVKVMLDGQGADEIFGGYDPFISIYLVQLCKNRSIKSAFEMFKSFNDSNRVSLTKLIEMYGYTNIPNQIVSRIGKILKKDAFNSGNWISVRFLESLNLAQPFDFSEKQKVKTFDEMRLSMVGTNLSMLLRYEDRNSMAHGIESRVPFLDHVLVEFALSLPVHYLLSQGKTKRVVTESLYSYIPTEIIKRRDKIGFQSSEKKWLIERDKLLAKEIKETIDRSGGILSENLMKKVSQLNRDKRNDTSTIWKAISFGRWLKIFNVDTSHA